MKGGVGKTTSVVNLSYIASLNGAKTLLWDLDSQGAATFFFRIKPKLKSGIKKLAKSTKEIEKSIKGTDFENLDLLPSDVSNRNWELKLNELKHPKQQLLSILKKLESQYDYVFIDCPPTLTILAENIFNAADFIFVPIVPTTLSLNSYALMRSFWRKKGLKLDCIYSFFSMIDRRKKLHRQIVSNFATLEGNFLEQGIPNNSEIEKMGIFRQPIPAFAPKSAVCGCYTKLWYDIQSCIAKGKKGPNNRLKKIK